MDQILTLWIDSEYKTAMRVAAARQGVSLSKMIRSAVEEYIDKHPDLFFDDRANGYTQLVDTHSQEVAQ